jgi:Fe-S cluster assembly protein SufD
MKELISISQKSKVADKPIEIMYFSTGTSCFTGSTKNLVIVGENAQVQIIERHQSLNENPVLIRLPGYLLKKRAMVDFL